MDLLTAEPIGIGSRFRGRVRWPDGQEFVGEEEIVDYKPNSRVAVRLTSGMRPNLDQTTFEAVQGGTRITIQVDFEDTLMSVLGSRLRFPAAQRKLMESPAAWQIRLARILET